jgi:ATP-dependent DNA helicase RecG
MNFLSFPIEKLSFVKLVYQKKLKKLGIKTISDLLFHFPHRYEDFSQIIPISQVRINQSCCILGKILEIENKKTWKKKMILTQAILKDKTGALKVVWFNQPYLIRVLKPKNLVCLAGKILLDKEGLYLSNPTYEKLPVIDKIRLANLIHTGRLVPVYPETEGLSSRWLRSIIKPLLLKFREKLKDPLPEKILKKENLLPIKEAIWQIHFPDSKKMAEKARERFSFEEIFFIQLYVLKQRMKLNKYSAIPIPLNLEFLQNLVKSLPFKLTNAQKKSAWQILKDLEKERPMNRLLEGDVGSGKTVVATLAILNVAKAGYQTAFMAPTEILAKQHFQTIWQILKNFNLNIGLLTGKEDKFFSKKLKNQPIEISRKKLLEKTKEGKIDLLIGTHALIQDKVKFGKLALVIVDEQHRFGVEQRARLTHSTVNNQQSRVKIPHLLSMTATPIPRTLALTLYGDLDLSLIDELPKGRKMVITKVIAPEERKKAYDFIRKEIKKGRQAFVICPRIERQRTKGKEQGAKEEIFSLAEVRAVEEEYERLSKEIFPDLKIGMLHGKMGLKEKEKIMEDFKNKKIDILVSTSVIEVGIDVPNATVMMIEGAERFGLAQLHQFRGRVGRSKYQSFCFLFSESLSEKAKKRLKALIECQNGFELAEKDLEIRGPGDFSGTRQWGIPDLVMSALKDIKLVEKTRETAKEILEKDPELIKYPLLREKLKKFRERVHLE